MSNWVPTVKTIADNIDTVAAGTVNPIISSLVNRDQYLFERIDSYEDKSVLLAYNVPVGVDVVTADTVVYYKPDEGVNKAISTYANSVDPSHLIPSEKSFVFGIVKQVYSIDSANRADVYLKGLVDITIANLLDSTSTGLSTGPLYLSGLQAGKLTFYPGGASVYVGYAVNADQLFLNPNTDSLNQLYFNYKVYLRDQPAGTPQNNAGAWSITSPDYDLVGWVNAEDAATYYSIPSPTGAKFFYNVPSAAIVKADGTLTNAEKKDALLYKDAIPPFPAGYTMIFVNGVLQDPLDAGPGTDGTYIINNYGVWWCNDTTAYIPWTNNSTRINIVLQATKLNPHYKSAVVSSLGVYKDNSNDSTGAISVVDAETGAAGSSGDLQLKFKIPVQVDVQDPVNNTFIKDVSYDEPTGKLVVQTSPGIVDVVPGPGITVNKANGVATVSLSSFSLSDVVNDVEPEDSEFAYTGLHSYLRIKNPATTTQRIGFVGKIALPSVIPAGLPLHVKLLMFSETNTGSSPSAFKFEYAISKADGTISTAILKANNGADIVISGVEAAKSKLFEKDGSVYYFEVPASILTPGAFLNFRIARVKSTYTGYLGVVGLYWAIE
jgi:hypothetical protein